VGVGGVGGRPPPPTPQPPIPNPQKVLINYKFYYIKNNNNIIKYIKCK